MEDLAFIVIELPLNGHRLEHIVIGGVGHCQGPDDGSGDLMGCVSISDESRDDVLFSPR